MNVTSTSAEDLRPDRRGQGGMRRFAIFLSVMTLAAFVLNWVWEMTQMKAYEGMAELSWSETAGRCTKATLGDVAITLGIYAIGATAAGNFRWGLERGRNVLAACALMGVAVAVLIERHALAAGIWNYNSAMPLLPWADVGLWPVLQLALLVPLAVWLGRKADLIWTERRLARKSAVA